MFQNDRQISRVIMVLWEKLPALRGLWTLEGPSDEAIRYHRRKPGWSHGEAVMFDFGFSLWNSDKRCRVADLLTVLDSPRLAEVGSLFIAIGSGTHVIEEWLSNREAKV